jgi:hypothetical protein
MLTISVNFNHSTCNRRVPILVTQVRVGQEYRDMVGGAAELYIHQLLQAGIEKLANNTCFSEIRPFNRQACRASQVLLRHMSSVYVSFPKYFTTT